MAKFGSQVLIFLKKNFKKKEMKKMRKREKNDAARNTDEQYFGQLHGMVMACCGWDRINEAHAV